MVGQTYLTATRFALTISSPDHQDFIAEVMDFKHPAITNPAAKFSTGRRDLPVAGSKADFSDLDVTFILDGALNNYRTLYDWWLECLNVDTPPTYDVTLIIYGMSETPIVKIIYEGAFVEAMGEIGFSTQDQTDKVLTCTATLKYDIFRIETI